MQQHSTISLPCYNSQKLFGQVKETRLSHHLQAMAMSKTLFASFLISLVILHLVESDTMVITTMMENPSPSPSPSPLPPKNDCGVACNGRCQLSSRPNLCKRACGTCCDRCKCVPSGTYDHYDECPCYANMTTRGGKHKCP